MKKIIISLILLLTCVSQAADFTIQLQPNSNSVGSLSLKSELKPTCSVTQKMRFDGSGYICEDITASGISNLGSFIQTFMSSILSNYILHSDVPSCLDSQYLVKSGSNFSCVEHSPSSNLLINSSFIFNQRGQTSGATIPSNTYGLDRWKAHGGSAQISFGSLVNKNSRQITISSGSIAQFVEEGSVNGGVYTLSWAGTASCYFSIPNITDSSPSNSPVVSQSIPEGTQFGVVCSNGTLSKIMLNQGSKALPFQLAGQDLAGETERVQRYYEKSYDLVTAPGTQGTFANAATFFVTNGFGATSTRFWVLFKVSKRVTPSVLSYNPQDPVVGRARNVSGATTGNNAITSETNTEGIVFQSSSGIDGTGYYRFHWTADSEIY